MASRLPLDRFAQDLPDKNLRDAFCVELEALIKRTLPDLAESISAFETKGLPVFEVACQFHLRALMMLSGVDYGFVSPDVGHYSDLIETLKKYYPDKSHVDFSKGLVLINSGETALITFIIGLYHWQARANGMAGYCEPACRLYRVSQKRFNGALPPKFLAGLSSEDLVVLRARIKREEEAYNFLRRMLESVLIPKNNAKRLVDGTAQA